MIIGALAAIGAIASAAVVGYQQYLTRWQLKSTLFDRRIENFVAIDSMVRKEYYRMTMATVPHEAHPTSDFYESFRLESTKSRFLFGPDSYEALSIIPGIMSKLGLAKSGMLEPGSHGNKHEVQDLGNGIHVMLDRFKAIVEPELNQYLTSSRIKPRPVYLISPFL